MSEVFGFDEFAKKLQRMENKAKTVGKVIDKEADNITKEAIRIAESKGLKVTGKGIAGIVHKTTGTEAVIGWSGRPNLHLYFHEKGFHAGFSKAIGRAKTGKKKRRYGKGRVYIAPKPHIKPATLKLKDKAIRNIKKHIMED